MAVPEPDTTGTGATSLQSATEQLNAVQKIISIAASHQALPVDSSPASPWTPPPSPALLEGTLDPTSGGAASPLPATSSDLLTQASSEEASTHSGSASVPQGAATAQVLSAASAAGDGEVGGAGGDPEASAQEPGSPQSPCKKYFRLLEAADRGPHFRADVVKRVVFELLSRFSHKISSDASFTPHVIHSECVAGSLDGLLSSMAKNLLMNSIPHTRLCTAEPHPEIQQPLLAWAIVAGHRSQRQRYLSSQIGEVAVRICDTWPLAGSGEGSEGLVFLCNSMLTYINALGVPVAVQAAHDSIFHESSTSGQVEPVYGCIPDRKTVKSGTDGGEHFRKFKHVACSLEEPTPSPDLMLRVLFWHIAFVLQEVAAHACIKRSAAGETPARKLCPDVLGLDVSLSKTPFLAYEVVLRTEFIAGISAEAYLRNKDQPGLPGVEKLRENMLVLDACLDTLQRVHEAGIVHGDVKPENFMIQVDREANTCSAVLIDLEGARADMSPMIDESQALAAMQAGLAGMFVGEFSASGQPKNLIKSMVEAAVPGYISTTRYRSPFLLNSHLLTSEESMLGLHITSGLDMWSVGVMVMDAILGKTASDPYLPGKSGPFLEDVYNLAKRVEYRPEETPCLPEWDNVRAALESHLRKMGATEPGPLVLCLGKCFARPHGQVPSAAELQVDLKELRDQLAAQKVDPSAPAEAVIEMPAAAGAGGGAAAEPQPPSHSTAPQTASADSYLGAR